MSLQGGLATADDGLQTVEQLGTEPGRSCSQGQLSKPVTPYFGVGESGLGLGLGNNGVDAGVVLLKALQPVAISSAAGFVNRAAPF